MGAIELEPLFDEKQNCLEEINKYFTTNRMGYIKVATGWGKTFLAKHLMKQYYEQGKLILFLASRNNQLLTQTFYADKEKSNRLFCNSLLLFSEKGKTKISDLEKCLQMRIGGLVVFASLQTLTSKGNEKIGSLLANTADLVVIDEIHNFIGNTGNDFINQINDKTRILGMTATPFQGVVGHLKFVDDIAADIQEIFSKTLPQCIIENQLSVLNYVIIRSNQSILDVFVFEPQQGLSELSKDELYLDCGSREKINLTIQRTKLAKQVYETEIKDKKSKTLVFCAPARNVVQGLETNEHKVSAFHAKICSAIFNGEVSDKISESFSFKNSSETGQFKNAVYLSSELPQTERENIVEAFKIADKPPYILCTVGMLIEGFDFPDLQNLMLLRPTLSMRLFEQQVGRVTRLPKKSDKRQGNIFEIADNIDSLYDKFKDNVFKGNNIERIQLLQSENRIEELFHDDDDNNNTLDAVKSGKIKISDLNFEGSINEFQKSSVEIPPVSLRAKFFNRLLSIVEDETEGELAKKKLKLMQMAVSFKIHDLNSANEIGKLLMRLEKLEDEALTDERLSIKCKESKPEVFGLVRQLLLLRALTYLKYSCKNMDMKEKSDIMHILDIDGDYEKIDEYRMQCLGGSEDEKELNSIAEVISMLNDIPKTPNKAYRRSQTCAINEMIIPRIYLASCFVEDNSRIKGLFNSREWNYGVKKYIVG